MNLDIEDAETLNHKISFTIRSNINNIFGVKIRNLRYISLSIVFTSIGFDAFLSLIWWM